MSKPSEPAFLGTMELASGQEKLRGHLAMLLFAALISGSFSLGSMAMPHMEPAALNSVRFMLASFVMGAIAFALYRRLPLPEAASWRFGVLGLLMAIYFVSMFTALKLTDPVSAGAVFTLIPIMSAGFGFVFLRQTVQPIVFLSLLIAGCGSVWVIFRADIDAIRSFDVGLGETIFFFGCICHAAYAPLVKKFNRREPVVLTTYWTTVATFLAIALFGAGEIVSTDWAGLPPIVWITILYLAVFTSAGTFFMVQYASMRLPASKVLSYGYLIPVYIIFYEGLLGHGWANMAVLAGAVVTVLGLLVVAFGPDL
ncbi:DMT family transporter [Hoeflea prorocentri]|uniref:DMT family transporter n=1 Tax=Hoeflea prorocentri TaxID=1922333 RepID=A0A9X3ZI00_9HYPH|nr:DMT family transporter [Hoeflea prorocentri]MCY6381361.1 DMT family transporter [Hoeflea prorocentri]MDA5399161.1 DMT family transporter [Hoeflea prorocentri]